MQPGKYNGEADVFVLRDILQYSKTKADAEAYMANAKRTFAIWVGVGDFATNKFDLVAYKADSALVYDDVSTPAMTGQPYIESVVYVDKHPQPSGEGVNGTLPTALKDFYGKINFDAVRSIVNYHQTGDLHAASYDFSSNQMQLAVGRINRGKKAVLSPRILYLQTSLPSNNSLNHI